MNRKKNIFKLFKTSQQKLEEMPSQQAWRKLEGRLDAHKNRNRISLYRSMAMVAALVALVAITFVVSLLLENRQQNPFALAEDFALPLDLETIDSHTDYTPGGYKTVEFRRKHISRLANPIVEGIPGKKLLPVPVEKNSFSNRGTHEGGLTTNTPSGSIVLDDNLRQFSWLLGLWEGAAQEGRSYEKWKAIDPNTLEGECFIKVDGNMVFKENMYIQYRDGEVYLHFPLVNVAENPQYKLLVQAGGAAVFENETIPFPNQIVFEKEDHDNFKTILQNKQPSEINSLQEQYFSNRYAIQKEQAVRSLHRLKGK